MSGIRVPYMRAVGIEVQMSGLGRFDQMHVSPAEERQFKVAYDILILLVDLYFRIKHIRNLQKTQMCMT